ncbi:MAG: response regulator transcription factor [Chitinophagaceae bacterium]
MISIGIIEDNDVLRSSLQLLFENSGRFQVAFSLHDARNLLAETELHMPRLLLMDIDMPGINGIDAVKLVKKDFPTVDIIMFTVFEDDEKIFRSVMAGASGYLLKKIPPEKLLEALDDFVQGGAPMTGSIATRVLEMFRKQTQQTAATFNLSARELEILTSLSSGKTYRLIAGERFLSVETVRSHVKNIYEKLHVHSKAEAVAKAFREKLI